MITTHINQHYQVECYDSDGNLKWSDDFDNLVTTEGRNTYLDRTLKTSVAPTWFVGLKLAGSVVAGDTMASHGGWVESAAYSETNRPALTLGTIASGSVNNSASKAVFTMNATATIAGAFITSNNTKSGTTGILLGAGDFAAARSVVSGDILNVTITVSLTSS